MLDGTRVVLVDDVPEVLDVLRAMLESRGAVVRAAGSAAEARPLLEDERPDVLVSDIGLPGEDGYSLIHWLRERERELGLPPIAAVAMTGLIEFADPVVSLRAGFHAHLVKPIDAEVLVGIIEGLLDRSASAAR